MNQIRICEFCIDRLEEFTQQGIICGACNGTTILGANDCFCNAYNPGECSCDADWSDYLELDLLTASGTFNTEDCMSAQDIWKIIEENKDNA